MSTPKAKIKRNIKQLTLYGIIGAIAASIDFAFFNILTIYTGLHYIVANCISVLAGIFTSFSLNRTFNFKVTDKTAIRFGIFFTIGILGLALSNVILWLGVEQYKYDETITKIASIFIVAFIQFILNKFITFKRTN